MRSSSALRPLPPWLLALPLLLLSPLASAQPRACAPLSLSFSISSPSPQVDRTHSYHELNAFSPSLNRRPDSLYRTRVLGLYAGNSEVHGKSKYRFTPLPAGGVGVCLESISLAHSLRPVIYLAREIPDGCGFNEVHKHEMGHWAIDTASVARGKPVVEQWGAIIPNYFEAASPDEGAAAAQRLMSAIIDKSSDYIFHSADQAQAQHDSPSEYQRIQYSCNNSLGKL